MKRHLGAHFLARFKEINEIFRAKKKGFMSVAFGRCLLGKHVLPFSAGVRERIEMVAVLNRPLLEPRQVGNTI